MPDPIRLPGVTITGPQSSGDWLDKLTEDYAKDRAAALRSTPVVMPTESDPFQQQPPFPQTQGPSLLYPTLFQPQIAPLKSSSWGRQMTSPAISPEMAEEAKGMSLGAFQRRETATEQSREALEEQERQFRESSDIDQYRLDELKLGYREAEKKAAAAKKKIEGFIFKDMPTSRKVVGALAIALGSIAEGISKSYGHGNIVNRVPDLINQAIERDFRMQRTRYQKLINDLEVSDKAKENLWGKVLKTEESKRTNALNATKLMLARAQQTSTSAESVDALMKAQLAVEQLSRGKTTKTTGGGVSQTPIHAQAVMPRVIGGAGAGGVKPIPNQINLALRDAIGGLQGLKTLAKGISRIRKGDEGVGWLTWAAEKIPKTESHYYRGQAESIALALSKIANAGKPTDKDTARFDKKVPLPSDPPGLRIRKVKDLVAESKKNVETLIKLYPPNIYDTAPLHEIWNEVKTLEASMTGKAQ